ncbi:MAG: pyridoxamine 5'-phosphate oxidase family protein [Acidimicrobiales bacterium]
MARSVRLSDDEAWTILERSHTGILTSLRRDGWPISLPVWFVALDRRIYVAGQAHTKKFARVRHDPRVCFVVESGTRWAELVGVQLTGRARLLDDGEPLERATAALGSKYERFRTPRSQMPSTTRQHYETRTATLEIVPDDRILSWDNARLFAADES